MDSKIILTIILLTSSIMLCCCENDESYIISLDESDKPKESIPHIRTRRCACESHEDRECLYFCSLDAVW
ncbi:endothelin precursor [Deerpox virus W-1170-84]|uniref:Endothelin n=1 Tax=Deerpox virus (strain W-1170-84) TaxID=305676 RepID=Q08FH4_DPV84|nr:endothelin precursor [Deerpox virus W-1170-84]